MNVSKKILLKEIFWFYLINKIVFDFYKYGNFSICRRFIGSCVMIVFVSLGSYLNFKYTTQHFCMNSFISDFFLCAHQPFHNLYKFQQFPSFPDFLYELTQNKRFFSYLPISPSSKSLNPLTLTLLKTLQEMHRFKLKYHVQRLRFVLSKCFSVF